MYRKIFESGMSTPQAGSVVRNELELNKAVVFNLGYAKTSYTNQNETQEPIEP
jgi:hypothetical protein